MLLYIDPSLSGISGDMFLGACIDLGADPAAIEVSLRQLNLPEPWQMRVQRESRCGLAGTHITFTSSGAGHHLESEHGHHSNKHQHDHTPNHDHEHSHDHHHHGEGEHHFDPHSHAPEPQHHHHHGRHFTEIRKLIEQSPLSARVRESAVAVFRRLGEAEAAVHGTDLDSVHFHEVGALDSILDIVGACVALELLEVSEVLAGPPVDGGGTVRCAHGTYPVPVPAVMRLMQGRQLRRIAHEGELVTPTGAAILAGLTTECPTPPAMIVRTSGYGLGSRDFASRPNALRLILGERTANPSAPSAPAQGSWDRDSVTLIETNVDDVTGEALAALVEELMQNGALDVALVPLLMKKGRPGQQLQIMCRHEDAHALATVIFKSAASLGIRVRKAERWILPRRIETVQTPFGPIRVKTGSFDGRSIIRKPEADDVVAAAKRHGVSPSVIAAACLNADGDHSACSI